MWTMQNILLRLPLLNQICSHRSQRAPQNASRRSLCILCVDSPVLSAAEASSHHSCLYSVCSGKHHHQKTGLNKLSSRTNRPSRRAEPKQQSTTGKHNKIQQSPRRYRDEPPEPPPPPPVLGAGDERSDGPGVSRDHQGTQRLFFSPGPSALLLSQQKGSIVCGGPSSGGQQTARHWRTTGSLTLIKVTLQATASCQTQ